MKTPWPSEVLSGIRSRPDVWMLFGGAILVVPFLHSSRGIDADLLPKQTGLSLVILCLQLLETGRPKGQERLGTASVRLNAPALILAAFTGFSLFPPPSPSTGPRASSTPRRRCSSACFSSKPCMSSPDRAR